MKKKQMDEIFSDEEFNHWSTVEDLNSQEQMVFDKYLLHIPKTSRILDIGTGGGRFLFRLLQDGFRRLSGIDMSARMVKAAETRFSSLESGDHVQFSVQRASQMTFENESQDVVIALQQIGSLIEDSVERIRTFHEFRRVLAPGGILVASFLNWKGRWSNPLFSAAIAPLKILKGELNRMQKNYLCWLKLGNRPNLAYLWTKQPYTYWFETKEVEQLVQEAGLEILEIIIDQHAPVGLYVSAQKCP